ncbi:hypothetical protein KHQ06_37205 [Nocardia tengchongensis]|uniref:Uncharacterized protein n=1 Tax=Nocardia tengchongensis TaxID=2055889 RepID=A0ABX8CTH9_9NOCA|nr:DUF6228 family protein [Nocardia tengchongensis]QVI21505.1 hypothetical protein KHQ06_37205 [Nocardia tengchongensis]
MTCEFDESMIEYDEAIQLSNRSLGGRVRLWHRTMPYSDGTPHDEAFVAACAELSGDGMTATIRGVMLDTVGGRSLPHFLDTLVADFAGWDEIRTWKSLNRELRIDAEHLRLGHVRLGWSLEQGPFDEIAWTATTTTVLEAGEQLRQFAATVRKFLRPGIPANQELG